MKITELLKKESIELGVKVSGKEEAIDRLVDLMNAGGRLKDKAGYKEGILAREAQGSTAVGDGIAIPHAKVAAVKEPGLAAMVVPEGVDYEAFDGSLANLIFMIAAPADGADVHLEALSRLSTLLMDPDFKGDLVKAKSKEEFFQLIDDKESERYGKKTEEKPAEPSKAAAGYRVLAVTACPTGIAHTFMAAENLEQQGKKLGIAVKVETNGAEGIGNPLTKDEIAAADGIIVAADKNVDMGRFDGKRVVIASVSDGIHKGEELIKRASGGEAPVYHHTGGANASSENSGSQDGIGRSIYKHLMNGVSHMLPFVIGGGILIALAFLFDDYSIDPGNFGKNTPLAAYLKTVGEQAFGMMLPVLAGYIAMSIADRPGLAVGFVGGLIAKMGSTFANPGGGDVNSGFLGALLAGFIGGYIVILLKKLFSKLPRSLEGIKPVLLYPLIGILLAAVVTTFINPFVGGINDAMTNGLNSMGGSSRILLGIVLGGMMSVDMGGPVNKAAYVFGTAQLAEGNFDIMAAVMAGGMVSPIAIALCTTFFKKKFTEKERQSGLVNYIMGLSFISEGAIPFAAADPIRVIPSCIAGSAVAGGLSMALGCTLRAPHGGIFVLPTIGNPFGYLLAVVIGSAAGCLVLAVLKKNRETE
ncbi:PTS fructose transporter subunit IIABC [Lacrimispora sp.]|uniref:PTS fructose transporter subunit IIABC n=1 Tax=Lacrimispora sp. TaxID=2719234 RepID=UPI002FD93566